MTTDEPAAEPAMLAALQAVRTVWREGWDAPAEPAGALGDWLLRRREEGEPSPDVEMILTLVDVAAGLCAVAEHYAPGAAEASLNAAAANAEAEAVLSAEDKRADAEAAERITDALKLQMLDDEDQP